MQFQTANFIAESDVLLLLREAVARNKIDIKMFLTCVSPLEPQMNAAPLAPAQVSEDALCREERLDLKRCEKIIRCSGYREFWALGKALVHIRDRRLFRENHTSVEEYAARAFDLKEPQWWMQAALVMDNLAPFANYVMPTAKHHLRPLFRLSAVQQRVVWEWSCIATGGEHPKYELVQEIAAFLFPAKLKL